LVLARVSSCATKGVQTMKRSEANILPFNKSKSIFARRITPEEEQTIIRLNKEGHNKKEIAKMLNPPTTSQTISNVLRRVLSKKLSQHTVKTMLKEKTSEVKIISDYSQSIESLSKNQKRIMDVGVAVILGNPVNQDELISLRKEFKSHIEATTRTVIVQAVKTF